MRAGWRRPVSLFVLSSLLLCAGSAGAEVVRKGNWPAEDPKVTLNVDNLPRAEALKRLADKAGWSVVIDSPPSSPVTMQLKDQPASKVLDLLLSDARYVATRDGTLINIARDPDAVSPAAPGIVGDAQAGDGGSASADQPAVPASTATEETKPEPSANVDAPPAASAAAPRPRGDVDDRVVTGGSTRVEANEVVHDLVVMGGSAEVLGTVEGDLVVMGGSAVVRKGARVEGDASVVGGSLDVEEGATVEGEVGVVGGKLNRGGKGGLTLKLGKSDEPARGVMGALSSFAGSVTRIALLFVFGTVLLALWTGRMESMQGEVAARPMRTFALGVVGSLVAVLATIVLCVTIVGIPIVLVGVLLGVLGTYAGICAALATLGAALVQHKTKSPYLHLAVGCVLFLLASSIPWIGGFVTAGVVLFGIGALVATRGAGFFVRKPRNEGPYRTAAA